MTSKDNLSRLTLIVPTRERYDFILRCMHYWVDEGPHLIILDGSAKPIEPANLDIFGSHIQYLHRPVGLYQRLSECLDLIHTEYVALAGDDEFYIPAAVTACIKELDRDGDLVACCGRALGFTPKNQSVVGSPQYSRLEDYAIDADSAEERIVQHMSDYVPSLIYAISRTAQWKTAWKYILQREFSFFAAGELQFEMFMAYAGRSKVVPELMWLRSLGEAEPIRGTDPSLDTKKRFPGWWADTGKEKEHEKFISVMSRGFSELLPSTSGDLGRTVVAGVEAYLEFYSDHKNSRSGLTILKRLALKTIPDFAKPALKSVLRGFRRHKSDQHTDLLQAAGVLEESGVRVYFQELEEIQKTIIQFHKKRNSIGF